MGTGSFSAEVYRGSTRIARTGVFEVNPAALAGCVDDLPYSPSTGFLPGNYRVDVLVEGIVVQSADFSIT